MAKKPDVPEGMISPCKLTISNANDEQWVECSLVYLDKDQEPVGGEDGEQLLGAVHASMVPNRKDLDVWKDAMQELFARLTDRALGMRPTNLVELNHGD